MVFGRSKKHFNDSKERPGRATQSDCSVSQRVTVIRPQACSLWTPSEPPEHAGDDVPLEQRLC